jgi:glycosyltransferase involved in cell wall biosynthesis
MIYHITKSLIGGGAVYAKRLSDSLCIEGHSSCVLSAEDGTLNAVGHFYPLLDRAIAKTMHSCAKQTMHSFLRQSRWRSCYKIDHRDIIHLHSVTGFIGLAGLLGLIPDRANVFWTAHNPWLFTGGCVSYAGCDNFQKGCSDCPILPSGIKGWAKLEHRAKRRFAQACRVHPIANSYWMAALMHRSCIYGSDSDIPIVPPIVDETFRPGPGGRDLRDRLKIDPDRYVIGLSSRSVTDQGKGIDAFFHSLPVTSEFLSDVTFLILGDGYISLPSDVDFRFTGHVEGAENLTAHYRAMDVFVSPSSMETFGMALLEAQACGVPVVAFSTGGTPEAVSPASCCHLVPNGDFAELFGALRSSVSDCRAERQQANELHRWVMSRHHPAEIARKQLAIYRRHGY